YGLVGKRTGQREDENACCHNRRPPRRPVVTTDEADAGEQSDEEHDRIAEHLGPAGKACRNHHDGQNEDGKGRRIPPEVEPFHERARSFRRGRDEPTTRGWAASYIGEGRGGVPPEEA